MNTPTPDNTTAVIGAGPIGIETHIVLQRAGIPCLHFERGPIANTITRFPQGMTFFSSIDRIAIADTPIPSVDQAKASKEQYLAYLRSLVQTHSLPIQTYTNVVSIERRGDDRFLITTETAAGTQQHDASYVVFATGDMHRPNMLNIPGEDLPHVTHYFDHPHSYFGRRLLIVGGKNSAAETALRCHHAGAHVTMSYRGEQFDDKHIKYWLLPELLGRIHRDEIACHYSTQPVAIRPTHVTLAQPDGQTFDVPTDAVILHTGFRADNSLLSKTGLTLKGDNERPVFDKHTMMSPVPNVFVAGTATAGSQQSYKVFIENCHIHALRIRNAILGEPPPPPPAPITLPEN
ncbi:MAG: NAD(P)-binding domain-containing protein [Planctomycetota bacterium]|jgi:thioredoxin reductase (NADPH)